MLFVIKRQFPSVFASHAAERYLLSIFLDKIFADILTVEARIGIILVSADLIEVTIDKVPIETFFKRTFMLLDLLTAGR